MDGCACKIEAHLDSICTCSTPRRHEVSIHEPHSGIIMTIIIIIVKALRGKYTGATGSRNRNVDVHGVHYELAPECRTQCSITLPIKKMFRTASALSAIVSALCCSSQYTHNRSMILACTVFWPSRSDANLSQARD